MPEQPTMSFRVDVYVHNEPSEPDLLPVILQALDNVMTGVDRIAAQNQRILVKENAIMADLSQIASEIAENGDAVESAVSLLGSLSEQIRQNATDPAALAALADQLDTNTQALADAVVANTPAAPGGGGDGEVVPEVPNP